MNETKEEMVSFKRTDIEALVGAFRHVRNGFLMCAPAYSAGSRGESIVRMAEDSIRVIQSIETQLRPKDPDNVQKIGK